MPPTLTLMVGMPGSGKSTWAAANHSGAMVLTADAIRETQADAHAVFAQLTLDATAHLDAGRDVLVDACSTTWRARARWLSLARITGARAELVIIETPAAECIARDARRAPETRAIVDWRLARERFEQTCMSVERERWDAIRVVKGDGPPTRPATAPGAQGRTPTGRGA